MKFNTLAKTFAIAMALCLMIITLNANATSETEGAIDSARERLKMSPDKATLHVTLAQLLAKRGRETANHNYYEQSLKAAEAALKIAPQNIGAARAKIWALLGQHEFAEAKTLAVKLNKRAPDDILTYAMLVDANVELGDYFAAEEAAQWLLDMRPGGVASLTRAAYLRELFGDLEGSILLLTQAIENAGHNDPEQQAWFLVHLGQLELQLGRTQKAESIVKYALETYPDYHYGLRAMVDVALRKGEIDQALSFANRFYQAAPHPENLFVLAIALKHAGKNQQAATAFKSFEIDATAEANGWDNANRELVYYLVDEAEKPAAALKIAKSEHLRRQDVFTKDAYAWALAASDQVDDAWRVISEALAVGTKSPQILLHAGLIANRAGNHSEAQQYLQQALNIIPWHPLALEARKTLSVLERQTTLAQHRK